jgi:hypothetical protein
MPLLEHIKVLLNITACQDITNFHVHVPSASLLPSSQACTVTAALLLHLDIKAHVGAQGCGSVAGAKPSTWLQAGVRVTASGSRQRLCNMSALRTVRSWGHLCLDVHLAEPGRQLDSSVRLLLGTSCSCSQVPTVIHRHSTRMLPPTQSNTIPS